MLQFAIKVILNGAVIFLVAKYLPGVELVSIQDSIILVLVLGLLNAVLRPILGLLALPITILTLGLFSFVLNGAIVLVADHFLAGFAVTGLWWAIIFSLVLSVVNGLVDSLVGNKK
jgi:putative membrane protein